MRSGRRTLSRRAVLIGAPALFAAGFALPAARAHRAKLTLSTVTWNPRTESLEVIHRIHVHDALVALARTDRDAPPDLVSLHSRARLALLVEADFALWDGDGAALPLDLIGAELEGDQVYVYQEAKLPSPPEVYRVRCAIFRSLFRDQGNHVNVQVGDRLKTLFFSGEDGPKVADLGSV